MSSLDFKITNMQMEVVTEVENNEMVFSQFRIVKFLKSKL